MAAWLDLYGYSVTVIDADWQQQSSEWLHEVAPQIPTHVIQDPKELEKTAPKLHARYQPEWMKLLGQCLRYPRSY